MKLHLVVGVWIVLIVLTGFRLYGQSVKLPNDKKQSTITYSMIHPLHQWDGVSREVNSILVVSEDRKTIQQVAVSVSLKSFDSKNANRDSHMIEVAEGLKFPNVTFASKTIVLEGEKLKVTGNMTFHGQTKEISFTALQNNSGKQMVVTGNFKLKLTQFGIEPPSLLGLATQDEFDLKFSITY